MKILPLLLLLPLLAAAEDKPIRITSAQAKAASIVTAPLATLMDDGGRRLPGQVVIPPAQMAAISSPLDGTVTAVTVAHGETVKRGQVVARLQGPQLLELQRQFSDAQAQADVAAEVRRRDETLFAEGIISRSRLAVAEASDRQARALLSEKRAALRLAGMRETGLQGSGFSGASDVRAPFDSVVLEVSVQPGQRVDAAAVILKLGRIDRLWLEMQATTAQAAGLGHGDLVKVPGCSATGKLTLVSPHLNGATQSLTIRAEFEKPNGCIKPFQFVNAEIQPKQDTQAGSIWRVPNAALVRHLGRAWLFVQAKESFIPVPVNVMDEGGQTASVQAQGSTLSGDQRVAVGGTAAIKAAWIGLGTGEEK